MRRLVRQFAVAAIALVLIGSAKGAYMPETACSAEVATPDLVEDYRRVPNQLSRVDPTTRFGSGLVLTHNGSIEGLRTNYSPASSSATVFLPEFPAIWAGLLLLVPLGASTLRILMRRSLD